MEINKIQYLHQAGSPRTTKASFLKMESPATKPDKVELKSTHDRDVVLNAIKAKVRQGFYKSDEVTDDITEKLAHLFEGG